MVVNFTVSADILGMGFGEGEGLFPGAERTDFVQGCDKNA